MSRRCLSQQIQRYTIRCATLRKAIMYGFRWMFWYLLFNDLIFSIFLLVCHCFCVLSALNCCTAEKLNFQMIISALIPCSVTKQSLNCQPDHGVKFNQFSDAKPNYKPELCAILHRTRIYNTNVFAKVLQSVYLVLCLVVVLTFSI